MERLIEFGELRPSLKKYGDLSYSNMKRIEVLQARRESVNEEIDRDIYIEESGVHSEYVRLFDDIMTYYFSCSKERKANALRNIISLNIERKKRLE